MISQRHVHHWAPALPVDALENHQSHAFDQAHENSGTQTETKNEPALQGFARDGLSMRSVLNAIEPLSLAVHSRSFAPPDSRGRLVPTWFMCGWNFAAR